MRPMCRTRQCRHGKGSLRCLALAAAALAALAVASGAFAQEAQGSAAAEGEEPAGEAEEEAASPATVEEASEQSLEAAAEGPVDAAKTAETAEEQAGDVEGAEQSAADAWDQFDEWEEQGGETSGGGQRAFNFELGGFVEALVAPRVVPSDASANELVANEARFRLNLDATHEIASARFRGDIFFDGVTRDIWFDVRDASIFVRPSSWFNMRFGRQVLTWGTGDFVFLNDLFPKDFNSFFIGRADEYLKAPSNSIITTFTVEKVGLDLVWTPIFEPDRFIDGERLSFFNPLGPNPGIIGDRSELTPITPLDPSQQLKNGTVHGRLYGTVGAYELAAYGYVGFWRQPNALTFEVPGDPASIRLTYGRLAVYGASVRGPLGGGLFNVEVAYYDSFKDRSGTDPAIPNSQFRGLAGYERELLPKFQMGLQYYLEYVFHYQDLLDSVGDLGVPLVVTEPEFRHTVTLRLTKLLVLDRLELSLFVFFSPNELDTYIRPRITYKIIDPLAFVFGANLMFGRDDYTFFGQLDQNTNVYARFRYSF